MIFAFDAELSTLINFYVVGVFTSFTFSQSGMVRHWLKEGRKGASAIRGWRRSIVINAIGAITTFVVLIVVVISKTPDGAWLSIVIMALLVPCFVSIHRHYRAVAAELACDRPEAERTGVNHMILLVHDLDAATAEALGYVRGIGQSDVIAVYPAAGRTPSSDLMDRWRRFAGDPLPLEVGTGKHLYDVVKRQIASLDRSPDDLVTIVIPEIVTGGLLTYLLRRRSYLHLKVRLLRERNVVVTDVPVHAESGELPGVDGRALIPHRIVTLAFVSSVNAASIRAVRYAMSIGSAETRAIHFQLDPEEAQRIQEDWFDAELPVPLDIVEVPFRDLTVPILEEIRRFTRHPDTIVNVIIPELIVRKPWHLFLHNQTALFVKRLLLFEERAILTNVPFPIRGLGPAQPPSRTREERDRARV